MVFQVSFSDELFRAKSALVLFDSRMDLKVVSKATWVLECFSTPYHRTLILPIITHQLQIVQTNFSCQFISLLISTGLCFRQINEILIRKIQSCLSFHPIFLFKILINLFLLTHTTFNLLLGVNFRLSGTSKHSSCLSLFLARIGLWTDVFIRMIDLLICNWLLVFNQIIQLGQLVFNHRIVLLKEFFIFLLYLFWSSTHIPGIYSRYEKWVNVLGRWAA